MNTDLYKKIQKKIDKNYDSKSDDFWRNKFHVEMMFGLINDPNGLAYYKDTYYIFFQWNPFGCEHKTKHWGLVKTKDFINYTKPEIILKPEDLFDKNGCYSGGALVKDNELKLYYTGNVKDSEGNRESYQCIADFIDNKAIKRGPCIEKQPEGFTAHFRDPMIFEANDMYYMILGVQRDNITGSALIYKSTDAEVWEFGGELKTRYDNFGFMWECPNIIMNDEGKAVFIFSPQGLEEKEYEYQNLYQSGYIIGDLDFNTYELKNHTDFKEIDMGFDFYAPQVFTRGDKKLMVAWAGMPDKDSEYVSKDKGWMFSLTMIRELSFKNGKMIQSPLKDYENLRETSLCNLKDVKHKCFKTEKVNTGIEAELSLNIKEQEKIDINLLFGEEKISLRYDNINNIFIIDRNDMSFGGKGIRKFKLECTDELKLHMFIDSNLIEIYINNGVETATISYYPREDGINIEISSDKEFIINSLRMWKLKEIQYN